MMAEKKSEIKLIIPANKSEIFRRIVFCSWPPTVPSPPMYVMLLYMYGNVSLAIGSDCDFVAVLCCASVAMLL